MPGTPSRFPATKNMFKTIFTVALLAGFLSGVGISFVQELTTTPLILHAEEYENADAGTGHMRPVAFVLVHGEEPHDDTGAPAWGPENGIERFGYTALANIVVGVGFALLLVASFVIYGGKIDSRRGVVWGMAGFAIFTLSPSLGLPPEVPGSFAAELVARQGWWLLAASTTALGLWLMIFRNEWLFSILGIGLIALPHIIGAPHPDEMGGAVPPELAGEFAAASMVTAAIFWAMLGWLSGTFYQRYSSDQ